MRILFAVPYLPSAIRVRSYNIIRELARRGHEVTLVAMCGKKEKPSAELTKLCKRIVTVPKSRLRLITQCGKAFFTGDSLWISSCKSQAMNDALVEASRSDHFDILHVEHIRATASIDGVKAKALVLDSVDCMEPLLKKIAQHKKNPLIKKIIYLESKRVGREESMLSRRFDRITVTSEREKTLLIERDPQASVDILPIGVDVDSFKPIDGPRDPMRLIFTGKMSYFPNADAVLWFVSNVYPRLKEIYPSITLTIAGAEPGQDILKLGKIPGIQVTGFVPKLEPLLQQSGISICPIRVAAGAQCKVIEAMACGLPVIASSLALRTMTDCTSLLEADTIDEWVEAVSGLLRDPQRAEVLGSANRIYVEEHCSWKSSVDRLEHTYQEALSSVEEPQPSTAYRTVEAR